MSVVAFSSGHSVKPSNQCCAACSNHPRTSFCPPISHSLRQPLFALIVFCLSPQVEDRDYLEKVGGNFVKFSSFCLRWSWCKRRHLFISLPSSGISSSFCLNSGNPHVFGRDFLAKRKLRDGRNSRCRDLSEGNQGNRDFYRQRNSLYLYLKKQQRDSWRSFIEKENVPLWALRFDLSVNTCTAFLIAKLSAPPCLTLSRWTLLLSSAAASAAASPFIRRFTNWRIRFRMWKSSTRRTWKKPRYKQESETVH